MIAMQYSFTLPADYDMNIIRQRIASKGHLLDNFPGLVFKAYLSASKDMAPSGSTENLYAPFYLWESSEAMNRFLCGPGFVAVSTAFGWPAVKTWSVWHGSLGEHIADARHATREVIAIQPFTALAELQEKETRMAQEDLAVHGALAAVTAFEPASWSLVRMRLWRDENRVMPREQMQHYAVGHLSLPGRKG
ncbi:DUF4865 family protein [Undibacterium sp. TJN25]|uniref:DUF4865 family protein n=1 Tax=Undibacterium sp. TJN25 TaxID=3413056 RepID=UPI003BF08321